MSSSAPGNTTSGIELIGVGASGIRLLRGNEELFLSYDEFPWFRGQPKATIANVSEVSAGHFYWPELDVDLSLESIRHPEEFPLKAPT